MKTNSHQQYIDLYKQQETVISRHSAPVMNAVRRKAFDAFCRMGLPTRKDERYKYTDMQRLFQPDLGLNLNRLPVQFNPAELFHCAVPNLSTLLYYVLNDGPLIGEKPSDGLTVTSFRKAAEEYLPLMERCYARLAKTGEDPIVALNTMLAQDGLLVYVPKGVQVSQTLQVVNLLRANVDLMVNRRVLIILEEGASLKLLFCDHALEDRQFLSTEVVEAFVGENASLEIYHLEETHQKNVRVSNTFVRQAANSRLTHQTMTLHNGQTRNTLEVVLAEPGAECCCNGAVIADKQQRIDNNTLIVHRAHHCTSNELYKYVLNQEAVGAFAGRVLVEKDAQQAVSQETNQNLCMTNQARMYTQPMLEIYADDVKCAHGSTVGQLNDAALFYMQQRGIGIDEAKLLLQTAFINEVVDRVPLEPLRDRLRYLVDQRFRGRLNQCEGCKLCK